MMIEFNNAAKSKVGGKAKKSIKSPLKWHGGKHLLAKWIVSLMPPRAARPNAPSPDDPGWLHFVEPYIGGGSVLFAMDPEGISEVINDLNGEVINFYDVLQSPKFVTEMLGILEGKRFAQREFEQSLSGHQHTDPVRRAAHFLVRNRQSRQGLGKDFATLTRNRTRRGMNEQVSAWLSAIDGLPEVHARLRSVVILSDDANKVIQREDGPRTLFYLDPPYLKDTRSSTGEYGEFEMTDDDHRQLLETLATIEGRFLLSGYRSEMYDSFAAAHGWRLHEMEVALSSSSKKKKDRRTECVWTNY